MAFLINVRLEQLARTTEAKFKIIPRFWRYESAIAKLQENFILLTVHSWYHHIEHHP